jgi:hypothetical protein
MKLGWVAVVAVAVLACAHSEAKSDDDPYAAHVAALKKRLRKAGLGDMVVRVEAPFVVVGDTADGLGEGVKTVRWAADSLEHRLFQARPTKILDIYLFESADSYEAGVKTLTGDEPTTPYGFYSASNKGLFMNIATGGGTLVHEIVHPYVEADFSNAPAWLNEGLGSLFEQSAEKDGHIVGLTNWRLNGLQKAMARGQKLPSFKELAAMSDHEFYAEERGTNYSQSRYLMYYLQEHDLLVKFYTAARAARDSDPTAYKTLVATLGSPDMADFQHDWEAWVAKLEFKR